MAQPYIGEIRMFGGNYAPAGWMFCEGQLLPISENDALFTLIGTTYGGDGESTFALPDLRGRVPVHQGGGLQYAIPGGVTDVTLTQQQIPVHTHAPLASPVPGSLNSPSGAALAGSPSIDLYRETSPSVQLAAGTVGAAGGSQPHTNVQPYLCVNFIISLFGIFPSPT